MNFCALGNFLIICKKEKEKSILCEGGEPQKFWSISDGMMYVFHHDFNGLMV